jgi:hypothetical protein
MHTTLAPNARVRPFVLIDCIALALSVLLPSLFFTPRMQEWERHSARFAAQIDFRERALLNSGFSLHVARATVHMRAVPPPPRRCRCCRCRNGCSASGDGVREERASEASERTRSAVRLYCRTDGSAMLPLKEQLSVLLSVLLSRRAARRWFLRPGSALLCSYTTFGRTSAIGLRIWKRALDATDALPH